MRKSNDEYSVYLDGGVGQDLSDPKPLGMELQPSGETPFCLGIVGDFSGGGRALGNHQASGLGRPLLKRITPENVLGLAGLTPEIRVTNLPDGLPDLAMKFSSLEDFHPDALYQKLDIFRPHREARRGITTGETTVVADPETRETPEPNRPVGDPGSGLLDAVLGETKREMPKAGSDVEEDLDAFLRRVVKPHVIAATPDHSQELEELDHLTSTLMSALLHNPEVRKLESLWRSMVFLLSRIEVTTKLRVYLIDVSKQELVADLLSTDEPAEWGFAHTLLRPLSEHGEELRWAALLSTFDFGRDPHDVTLLQRLGLLAESGGVPFLGAGDDHLLGSRSLVDQPDPRDWTEPLDPLWLDLRQRPEADWIALSIPAFLLRTPYGPGGGKTKRFGFVEGVSSPADLLLGSPCILWGVVLGQEFARAGWDLRISGRHALAQIPMWTTPEGWGSPLRVNFSHSAAARVQEMGLIPVTNNRNEPGVALPGFASISATGGSLRAWWKDAT